MNEYKTIKIWPDTRRLLNITRAITGESQVELINRLITEEYSRQREKTKEPQPSDDDSDSL